MSWLNYHRQAIKLVLARMRQNRLSTLMICLVIGVAMCIPGLFYLGVDNLSRLTSHMQNENEISLFLKLDTSSDTVQEISGLLAKNPAIKQFRLVTKDEAWQQLQAKADSGSVIRELNKNPLPDAFFIQANTNAPEELEALRASLQEIPGVEQALFNADWAKRLAVLLSLGKQVIYFIAALLATALLVIIGNTVRMQILTQKVEIEVSKLIGATNSFIRMPFLYAGMLYGVFGGLLAIVMIAIITQIFNVSVAEISSLYHSDFSLAIFNGQLFGTIVLAATLIGWLGSYIAVSRSITAFEVS